MYKIYINDLPITLIEAKSFPDLYPNTDALEFHYETNADLLAIISYAELYPMAREIVVWSDQLNTLKTDFFGNFKYIEAGGGVVFNSKNEILLIKRHNVWDLPKGKLKINEPKAHGALREVEEETGVQNLEVIKPITLAGFQQTCTYHNYASNLLRILKATYWFTMKTDFDGTLIPQAEEGIQEAKWININEVMPLLRNSYRTIQDVAATAIDEFYG